MSEHTQQTKSVAVGIATAMLVGGAIAIGVLISTRGIHLTKTPIYPKDNRQLSNIPTETTNWTRLGSDRVESAEVLEVLGTENYLSRDYIEKDPKDPSRTVLLALHGAYYTGGIDTVPHIPERCFVGGGLQQSISSHSRALTIDTTNWTVDRSVPKEFGGDQRQGLHRTIEQ